jgi:uncharacterized membrane protein YhaH (DUF805 family)
MSMPLQLVFFGELIEGFGSDEVRRNLAQSFKLGDEQLDRMFGGNAVVLKRNLVEEEAVRYVAHLASLGARAQMRPMPGAANTPSFKIEQSAAAPLPTLVESDGPRNRAPFAVDPLDPWRDIEPARAEAIVPLRAGAKVPASFAAAPASFAAAAAPFAPPAASPYPHAPALPLTIEPGKPHKGEVTCPKCSERQPMTLLCRNCATNLEMALAARAEDERAARAERIDATRARHGLPPSGYGTKGIGAHAHSRSRARADDPPPLWGVGWDGRISRMNYATGIWAMSAATTLVDLVTYRMPAALGATLGALAGIAVVAMSLRQTALRFHDRGHSGWWNLLWTLPLLMVMLALASPRVGMRLLIPAGVVLLGATLYLLFFRGDDDDNAYGSPPREGSGGALLVSIVATVALGNFAPVDSALGGRLRNIGSRDDAAVVERLRSSEAKRAYMTEYLLSGDQKAFAASPDGSWGWVAEARTDDAAMTEALGTCEKHRPATQRPCELVSVNGRPVGIN